MTTPPPSFDGAMATTNVPTAPTPSAGGFSSPFSFGSRQAQSAPMGMLMGGFGFGSPRTRMTPAMSATYARNGGHGNPSVAGMMGQPRTTTSGSQGQPRMNDEFEKLRNSVYTLSTLGDEISNMDVIEIRKSLYEQAKTLTGSVDRMYEISQQQSVRNIYNKIRGIIYKLQELFSNIDNMDKKDITREIRTQSNALSRSIDALYACPL